MIDQQDITYMGLKFEKQKTIYIFGAHSRAQTFGVYIKSLYPDIEIAAYLYDNDEDNLEHIEGVPVFLCKGEFKPDTSLPVYIATRGVFHKGIAEHLRQLGFKDIISVSPEMDMELRNRFIRWNFGESGRKFYKIDETDEKSASVGIYTVKSAFDSQMQIEPKLNPYERYIQAGAALTDKRLSECNFFDNEGDNISQRNKQFCELTALYWIWKNAKEDIVGLEHYRRRFILTGNWKEKFENEMVDILLPVPLYVSPSLKENYIARHTKCTWDAMMEALKHMDYEKYEAAKDFFENTGCYSPCNMMIMRKAVLDEFCSWLFPVIFQVAGKIGELSDSYQNRYPGFLAERLLTFWCFFYENKYKVVYADKNFLK